MTPERFERLADAWGGDLHRWPAVDRDAAQGFLAEAPRAHAVLARAGALDELLDAHVVASPSAAWARDVLDALPRSAPRRSRVGRWHWGLSQWWFGAGVAGLGLVGAGIGVLAVSIAFSVIVPSARPDVTDSHWSATAFDSGGPAEWSEK